MKNPSFLVLTANTPWVYSLAQSLATEGEVTAVRFYDWLNHRRLKAKWPETESRVRRILLTMPPGYAGRLERFFRPLMAGIVANERSRLRRRSGLDPFVVCPYPYLAPWVRSVPDDRLVYYNLDDYALYDPARADRTRRLEDELVRRARLTICLSKRQVENLRARHPAHARRIAHFPLGVVEDFLNPTPDAPPLAGTVGYVGNLIDRVDWRFIAAVAERVPEARFHIVGRLEDPGAPREGPWREARECVLKLPNVVYEGEVPQGRVREHYWRYMINWMPYDPDHAFNIASCPTKIMDALASGRPFLSTDIPEARLYKNYLHLLPTAEDTATRIRQILAGKIDHNSADQVRFAAKQTWKHRATDLLEALNRTPDLRSSFPGHGHRLTSK